MREAPTQPPGIPMSPEDCSRAYNEPGPHLIRVPDQEEFRTLITDVGEVLDAHYTTQEVDKLVRHEAAHARAAAMLGATTLCYEVNFRREFGPLSPKEGEILYTPFTWHSSDRELTPLEKAAVAAHPTIPSTGDLGILQTHGFAHVHDVGEAAVAYNRERGEFAIPVPLSYSPRSSERAGYNLLPAMPEERMPSTPEARRWELSDLDCYAPRLQFDV